MTIEHVRLRPEATTPARVAGPRGVTVLFALTSFTGAALLFVVQPLVAKLLLPSYGGSATVWSTSSLFFQVLLLVAYLYVHLSTKSFGQRRQPLTHLPLLFLPALLLPLALPADAAPPGDGSPALWLLRTLTLMIGLPFAVVATTGPMLQKWFSWSSDHRADDPYFLFAASNLGSFGGLLAYPLLIEPTMSLHDQRIAWSVGFVLFGFLSAGCAVVAMQSRATPTGADVAQVAAHVPRLRLRRLLVWAGLAFLPASLSLAVTAHISTDVAAIPLLWVIPLAIYLATFVLAFTRRTREPPRTAMKLACAIALAAAAFAPLGNPPVWLSLVLDLTLLAVVGYVAHARLASDRPPTVHLTQFYLVVAAGGAAGGLLNGLAAPALFDRIWEFPATLALIPVLLLGTLSASSGLRPLIAMIGILLAGTVALSVLVQSIGYDPRGAASYFIGLAIFAGILGWALSRAPVLLGLALLAPFVVTQFSDSGTTIEHTRSFFGAYRVDRVGDEHRLIHGTTVHGRQFQDAGRRDLPTTYYASPGSVGDVFTGFGDRFAEVGVIGLGTGTVATYGHPGQHITFYEIDADIVRTARDARLFTFLRDSEAEIDTVVGDGRLRVAERRSGTFDLLVLDAFSSDSIPVHLLTREAMRTYADRLKPGGVLAVHISNRVFGLRPVLAGAAADLGWRAEVGRGDGSTPGSVSSEWVVLTSDPGVGPTLRAKGDWAPLDPKPRVDWTDDYSSLLAVLR